MSTHAKIGIYKRNTLIYIYCHFDGYLKHAGNALLEYCPNETKVRKLLKGGWLDGFDHNDKWKPHYLEDDEHRYPTMVSFSHVKSIHDERISQYLDEEYNYCFYKGKWWYSRYECEWNKLTKEMIERYG